MGEFFNTTPPAVAYSLRWWREDGCGAGAVCGWAFGPGLLPPRVPRALPSRLPFFQRLSSSGFEKISSLRAPEDLWLGLLAASSPPPPSLPSYSHQGSTLTGASEAPVSAFLPPCFVRKLQLATGTGRMSDCWKQQAPRRDKKPAPVCHLSAPTVTGQATAGEMARRRWPRGAGAHRLGAPRGGGLWESCVF